MSTSQKTGFAFLAIIALAAPIKFIDGKITSSPSLTYKFTDWNNPSVQLEIGKRFLEETWENITPSKTSKINFDYCK